MSPAAPTTTATSAAPTVEERRLERPAPQEILLRSGFDDDAAPALARALDGARSVDDADRTNSPCSFRWASSSLLSTPSSLASS